MLSCVASYAYLTGECKYNNGKSREIHISTVVWNLAAVFLLHYNLTHLTHTFKESLTVGSLVAGLGPVFRKFTEISERLKNFSFALQFSL